MSEKKTLKRTAKTVWDRVKRLRQERGKLYAAEDMQASAAQLAQCADELKDLARQIGSLSTMPALDPALDPAPAKRKPKTPEVPG